MNVLKADSQHSNLTTEECQWNQQKIPSVTMFFWPLSPHPGATIIYLHVVGESTHSLHATTCRIVLHSLSGTFR